MNKNKYPLRKVVDQFYDNYMQKEKLECGHTINRPRDIYGYTNAERRRCKACFLEQDKKVRL